MILSGLQVMPWKPNLRKEAEKFVNVIGNLVFPALVSMSLPSFLYILVLEKEMRLVQNMKINGLQMWNY